MTERRAWILLAVALALLLGGGYLVRGNHYAHLHRQIHEAYAEYMQDWERDVRSAFAATTWELHVQGREHPLPLLLRSLPIKRPPRTKTTSAAATPPADEDDGSEGPSSSDPSAESGPDTAIAGPGTGSGGGGGDDVGREARGLREHEGHQQQRQQGQGQRARGRRPAPSPLFEFRLEGLMEALHPARVPPLDRHSAAHSRLWRPVGHELQRPVAMWLVANDSRTGAVSTVELGPVAFTRETTVAAGGQGRCIYEERGVWQEDGTCSVQEYLWGLCVKVAQQQQQDGSRGGNLVFVTDNSTGGGPGCGPEWRWQAGQWRRLDERRHTVHGRLYLPLSARNSTIVTVRHARDPAILESDLVRRLAPNVEQQILLHAVGLAMCFLALVLLLSVGAFAVPALARRAGAVWATLRGRRPKRTRRGRGDGSGGAVDCFGFGRGSAEKDSGDEAE